ncbi:MAG: hypothetical protein FWF81_07145 [Defluviitaleaceae bacterium]|nr:hypothetical protein [Defluviitaleaceae bacterium]
MSLSYGAEIELSFAKLELLKKKAKNILMLAGGDKSRAGAVLSKSPPVHVQKAPAREANVREGTCHRYL